MSASQAIKTDFFALSFDYVSDSWARGVDQEEGRDGVGPVRQETLTVRVLPCFSLCGS